MGGGTFQIEPDASSASYFHAVNALFPSVEPVKVLACQPPKNAGGSGWQIDAEYPRLAPTSKGRSLEDRQFRPSTVISRKSDLGDSIMTAIATAALASKPCSFTNLGVLRKQECERVHALRDELTKCKAQVTETGDTLELRPCSAADLGNAEIHTYHDHRMAMCFATLAFAVPGIKISDPSCVR